METFEICKTPAEIFDGYAQAAISGFVANPSEIEKLMAHAEIFGDVRTIPETIVTMSMRIADIAMRQRQTFVTKYYNYETCPSPTQPPPTAGAL